MTSDMNSSMHSRRLGPHGTPESEFNNFECFQNYTAPEVFVQGLAGIVNQGDVEIMIRAQKQMLQRFEKTNEMLLNCNALSVSRLKTASDDFKKHSKMLGEMKKDLDYIFKKIRNIKAKINAQYPEATLQAQPKQRPNSFCEATDENTDDNGSVKSVVQFSGAAVCATAVSGSTDDKSTAKIEEKLDVDGFSGGGVAAGGGSDVGGSDAGGGKIKSEKSMEKKKTSGLSFDYVQMEHSPSDSNNGSTVINVDDVQMKRRSLESTGSTDSANDSSDCTSDTG